MKTVSRWGLSVSISLLVLVACTDAGDKPGKASTSPAPKPGIGSVCQLTSVNGVAPRAQASVRLGPKVLVAGWATAANAEHPVAERTQLVLSPGEGTGGKPLVVDMGPMPVEELAASNPKLEMAGFEGIVTFPAKGMYRAGLVLEGATWRSECDTGSLIEVVD